MIFFAYLWTSQALDIIANSQHHLVCHHAFRHQIECHAFSHLLYHHTRLLEVVRFLQHLPTTKRVSLRPIRLHGLDGARLPAPGMVYQQFGIDAKEPVEQFLIMNRHARNLPHRFHAMQRQFVGNTLAHPPELGDGSIVPQLAPIRHLVEFGNTHAVLISRHLLRHNIHRHLAEIHIGADASRSRDARLFQHVAYHRHSQFVGRHLVSTKIGRDIHKHLVDAIDMDILRSNVLQIDAIHPAAHLDIVGHPGRRDDKVHATRFLIHLEQSCAPSDAIGLQTRRHRQTDGLLRPTGIRHHQVRSQRVQPPVQTLHRSVKRLQVDGYICPLCLLHSISNSYSPYTALQS